MPRFPSWQAYKNRIVAALEWDHHGPGLRPGSGIIDGDFAVQHIEPNAREPLRNT